MHSPHFVGLSREDYEHIVRALVVYDHIRRSTELSRKAKGEGLSELRERWLGESERFGLRFDDQERDSLIDQALREVDEFVDGEVWQELAWWIAERECKRLSSGCADEEARELVTDRIFHQVMEEFSRHGIDRLSIPGLVQDILPLRRVAETLRLIRSQTKDISGKASV